VWETRTGARVGPAMQHERWVRYAAFSPDAQRVVTISSDYTARLWVSRTGEAASSLMRHEGVVIRAVQSRWCLGRHHFVRQDRAGLGRR
jgi:WD40 repeat protein